MSESLLTLNESTLYYYFLSDTFSNTKETFSGINNWAAAIPDNTSNKAASASGGISKSLNRSQASGSRSRLPALTNATSRSSTSASVLSKNIKISQPVKARAEPHDTSPAIKVVEFGLQDEDETMGVEREAAFMSPPKGKVCISSAVSKIFRSPQPLKLFLKIVGSC